MPAGFRFEVRYAVVDENTAANNEIVAAITGKRIVVLGYVVVNTVATAQTVVWKSGTTALTGTLSLPSSIGGGVSHSAGEVGCFETAAGAALNLTLSAATAVGGHVAYFVV